MNYADLLTSWTGNNFITYYFITLLIQKFELYLNSFNIQFKHLNKCLTRLKITPDLQSLSSSAHTADAWRCWWIMCDNLSRSHSSPGCYVPFGSNCWTRTVNNNNNNNDCKQSEATAGILKEPETPEGSAAEGRGCSPSRSLGQGTPSWGHSCPTVEWRRLVVDRGGQGAMKIWNHGQVLLNAVLNLTPSQF